MTHTTHNLSARDAEPRTETPDAQADTDSQSTLGARLAALDLTDVGNAERLIVRHVLRFTHAEQKWYAWQSIM